VCTRTRTSRRRSAELASRRPPEIEAALSIRLATAIWAKCDMRDFGPHASQPSPAAGLSPSIAPHHHPASRAAATATQPELAIGKFRPYPLSAF
jgi:hypothetical protein